MVTDTDKPEPLWRFEIWTNTLFRQATETSKPLIILIGGFTIDALLLALFIFLAGSNKKAHAYATKMSRKYQEEAQELEEFAYRTSHDLRSPLISSIGLLDVARGAIDSKDQDMLIQSLDHTQASLKKLEALVEDILMLTKAKNAEEDEQIIDVPGLVQDVLKTLENMDGFSRLDIQTTFDIQRDVVLKKSRVELIVSNLISNAVKYQDPDEPSPVVDIKASSNKKNFVFEVSDNGLGVPESHQKHLFSMFKRFHTHVSFGSGLGLYMIKKSATVLDGDIDFKALDKGSRFILTIPLR